MVKNFSDETDVINKVIEKLITKYIGFMIEKFSYSTEKVSIKVLDMGLTKILPGIGIAADLHSCFFNF